LKKKLTKRGKISNTAWIVVRTGSHGKITRKTGHRLWGDDAKWKRRQSGKKKNVSPTFRKGGVRGEDSLTERGEGLTLRKE